MSRSPQTTSPTPTRTKRKTNAELAAELEAANQELATLRGGDVDKALNDYKDRVKKAAQNAKDQHGWCDEIDEILEEIGIDITPMRFQFTMMVPVTIEANTRHSVENAENQARLFEETVDKGVLESALVGLGAKCPDGCCGVTLLSDFWETYVNWSLKVGDITVQDIEEVKT